MKCGLGTHTWPDGRQFVGYWLNNKQNGPGKYITAKSETKYGIWDNGIRQEWINLD